DIFFSTTIPFSIFIYDPFHVVNIVLSLLKEMPQSQSSHNKHSNNNQLCQIYGGKLLLQML
ncbi:hypothetical protein, partial [Serratia sp. 121840017-1]